MESSTRKLSVASALVKADTHRNLTAIQAVTAANAKLAQELVLESKQDNQVNNSSASAEIKRLQDQGDSYTKKIELERRRIAELDKQIGVVQAKVNAQRKKMGGIHVSKTNNETLGKQIRVLENRLDKAIVRYNEILGKNKLLRGQIDSLRKERSIFGGIYAKLEKEMLSEKSAMGRLVEECNEAYEQRDQAKMHIDRLKKEAEDEEEAFQAEWKKLGDLIEHDKKTKSLGLDHAGEGDGEQGPAAASLSADEKKALKRGAAKGAWSIGKDKAKIAVSQEKAHNYEEMFNQIQAETGVTDIDELVQRFVQGEETNFALFNRVNDLNKEMETLEVHISGTESEIEKYRGQGANAESQRKKILTELERSLQDTRARSDEYEAKHGGARAVLQVLNSGIGGICDKLGTDKDESLRAVLGTDGVTDANVLQYLGVIEQRANELLHLYSAEPAPGATSAAYRAGGATSVSSAGVASADRESSGPEDRAAGSAPAVGGAEGADAPEDGEDGGRKSPLPTKAEIDAQGHLGEDLFDEESLERPLTTDELKAALEKQAQ